MRETDRELVRSGQKRNGIVTVEEATGAGMSKSARSRRVRSGFLDKQGPHTYALPGSTSSWETSLRTGLADLGEDAVVGGRPSLLLLGVEGLDWAPVEFVVPRAQRERITVGKVRSVRSLTEDDRTEVDGIACLSATRALIEAAARLTDEPLGTALASAVRKRLTAIDELQHRLEELWYPARPGAARLRRLLGDGPVESWLERRFLRLLREAGLPRPVLQQRHRLAGGSVVRVDFAFDGTPVVVEVGGKRGYLEPADRLRKERRRNELQLAGKVVFFFAYEDITERSDHVAGTVAAALAPYLPHLGTLVARKPGPSVPRESGG